MPFAVILHRKDSPTTIQADEVIFATHCPVSMPPPECRHQLPVAAPIDAPTVPKAELAFGPRIEI
jgi:hypothetical protein